MRPSFSQWCAVMRISGLNFEHRRFCSAMWKNFFKIIKTHLDAYLYDLLCRTCLSRGVGLDDLLRSLPAPAICDFGAWDGDSTTPLVSACIASCLAFQLFQF